MKAYYNENDPYVAQWLRNLIKAGHIAAGDVDERSIVDVRAEDLSGYTQCHFFAGIGGWSLALRLAGWSDDRPVWTGSCPCQPFSSAGAGKAADDERHLWPAWFSLIRECGPAIVFGEQVEAAIGWGWLDVVFSDLEGEGYACGTTVLPACGVGAPHIRQRTWFVANALRGGAEPKPGGGLCEKASPLGIDGHSPGSSPDARICGSPDGVANPERNDQRRHSGNPRSQAGARSSEARTKDGDAARGSSVLGHSNGSGHALGIRLAGNDEAAPGTRGRQAAKQTGHWNDCEWLPCIDGKSRPVEPGTFPLAHGVLSRVGRLRAYGNAIVPQVAAEFIMAAYV